MECDVCIGTDEDFNTDFFMKTPIKKSRKPFRCCECHSEIPIGSPYVRTNAAWEGGQPETFRQCVYCEEIQRVFSCGQGYMMTTLWDDFSDGDAFYSLRTSSPCFQKLSIGARNFLVDRWWKWKIDHAE